jgi:uncharacterized membrane protein
MNLKWKIFSGLVAASLIVFVLGIIFGTSIFGILVISAVFGPVILFNSIGLNTTDTGGWIEGPNAQGYILTVIFYLVIFYLIANFIVWMKKQKT